MLEELKQKVYEANMELPAKGLITYTWGNVSGIDREKGLFVIKPSGVPYETLKPSDMVVMTLAGEKGKPIIDQKLAMVKKYMKDSWQVDLDLLRKVIARRTNEISELDLDHIY